MLDNLVYLVAFMSVLFISLGILSLAEEKIPFLHKMTIRLINAMTFNENDKIVVTVHAKKMKLRS